MTTVGQAATAEIVTGAATAPGWLARAIGLGAVALALLSAFADLRGAGQPHADPAQQRGRGHPPARQRGHGAVSGRHHGPRGLAHRAGPPPRPRRRAAACAHRRPVLGGGGGSGDPGGGGGERHAGPRARSAVLAADPVADPELADRVGRLCARACPVPARRLHHHRHRGGARTSRCSIRTATSFGNSSSPPSPTSAACPPS